MSDASQVIFLLRDNAICSALVAKVCCWMAGVYIVRVRDLSDAWSCQRRTRAAKGVTIRAAVQLVTVYPEAATLIQTEHAWIIDNLRHQVLKLHDPSTSDKGRNFLKQYILLHQIGALDAAAERTPCSMVNQVGGRAPLLGGRA